MLKLVSSPCRVSFSDDAGITHTVSVSASSLYEAGRALGGPDRVLDYLGRYTHRVAVSNHRLQAMHDGQVTFPYKDYKHPQRQKVMTLSADEFLRRFLLHVLPECFQRIRHYGLLGNRHRAENLARCRELLAMPVPIPATAHNYR
jgi:hypothetical protein